MNDQTPLEPINFKPDFVSAERLNGELIKFTRSEARALSFMAENPNQILTRNQILDAVSEPGSDTSDRNIDFLINRIRRKLDDSAKDPRRIAMRYGEGYIWLIDTNSVAAQPAGTYMVVGPLRGIELLAEAKPAALKFANSLNHELTKHVRPDQYIAFLGEGASKAQLVQLAPEIQVELAYFENGRQLECIISTKSYPAGRVISVKRFEVFPLKAMDPDNDSEINKIASSLLGAIWKSKITGNATIPLPVAMHDAAGLHNGNNESWVETDKRLKPLLQESPDDDGLKIMYATHLHSKYILLGQELFLKGTATCQEDEDEIERLTLEALPFAQAHPDYAIMAAKLLYFVVRGHQNLAVEMAEEAHKSNTMIASSLAIVGQMRTFSGQIDEGLLCLRQAAGMSEKGSEFHVYTLVMMCQTLLAAGNRDALALVRKELYSERKLAAVFFEFLLTDIDKPSLRARRRYGAIAGTGLCHFDEFTLCWGPAFSISRTPRKFHANACNPIPQTFGERCGCGLYCSQLAGFDAIGPADESRICVKETSLIKSLK